MHRQGQRQDPWNQSRFLDACLCTMQNVQVYAELEQKAKELGLARRVHMMPSFTDRQRRLLLAACIAVIYTPQVGCL
jgi:hypothetical protein